MTWRRFDTLFVRLFLLMWVTLVASHFIAYVVVLPAVGPDRLSLARLPTLPSLPPGNPFRAERTDDRPPPPPPEGGDRGPSAGPGGPQGLPQNVLWLDYGVRMLVIALGALLGARWLAAPMRQLSHAAGSLAQDFARGGVRAGLDERRGTREVRDTARIFNRMAVRLQEQFDARGLHMAALSHDLRTPLTRLRIRVEQAAGPMAPAASADIREMDEMIASTLAVLREQRDGAAAQPVALDALLQSIVDDLAELGEVVALAPSAALRARAHPASLRRVVGNLVDNALRHGGSARIALDALPAGEVEIVVDDDGPGIPPAQVEQAFEPWVRLAGSEARAGHGLGLAIARDLAERDGGRITLHNRPEGGLRARLRLPAA